MMKQRVTHLKHYPQPTNSSMQGPMKQRKQRMMKQRMMKQRMMETMMEVEGIRRMCNMYMVTRWFMFSSEY
jgi:hypothetical protein